MSHVADRILAAVLNNLSGIPGIATVDIKPLDLLEEDQLPAVLIDEIDDEVQSGYLAGHFPVDTTRKLSFVVKVCLMAAATDFKLLIGGLHELVELALVGSESAVSLNGLLTRGLMVHGGSLFSDSESLQQPVGGWRIPVTCTYNLRSDQPGKTEKEL